MLMFFKKYRYYLNSLINHRRFLNKKILWKTLKGTFYARILRVPRVRNCQMALTFYCNHKCTYCSSSLLLKKREYEMSETDWYNTVDQLKNLGCTHFDITGGEPSLVGQKKLCDLIKYINHKRDSVVSLATNGKVLDINWLLRLKESGLTALELNLQSVDEAYHDEVCQAPGNYKKIMSLIEMARSVDLNVCINTCLGVGNWHHIEKLMDWCEEKKMHCLLNLAAPTGELVGEFVRIEELKEKYYNLLFSHYYSRSDTSYNYRGFDMCPGGIEKLYITCYGDVMQCTFCQISFGNILKEPLSVIHRRFISNPLIRKREICKQTFNKIFQEDWVQPAINNQHPPMSLFKHPLYEGVIETNISDHNYRKSLGFLYQYLVKRKGDIIIKLLKKRLNPQQGLCGLDVGCGYGQYTRYLRDKTEHSIYAVEPNRELRKIANEENRVLAGENINKNQDFDFSYVINVLHHARDPVQLLKDMNEVTTGIIIISELNRKNPFVRWYIQLRMAWENYRTHFDDGEVEDLISYAGLMIVDQFQSNLLGIPAVYNWFVAINRNARVPIDN